MNILDRLPRPSDRTPPADCSKKNLVVYIYMSIHNANNRIITTSPPPPPGVGQPLPRSMSFTEGTENKERLMRVNPNWRPLKHRSPEFGRARLMRIKSAPTLRKTKSAPGGRSRRHRRRKKRRRTRRRRRRRRTQRRRKRRRRKQRGGVCAACLAPLLLL